jgi:hypothetical protein
MLGVGAVDVDRKAAWELRLVWIFPFMLDFWVIGCDFCFSGLMIVGCDALPTHYYLTTEFCERCCLLSQPVLKRYGSS